MRDPRSFAIAAQAVALIASGGRYAQSKIDDVVPEILLALDSLDEMFADDDAAERAARMNCDCETCRGAGDLPGERKLDS